jgi:ABC-type uncharacterized transport system involved in gliding motility auxiliary subunit
MKLNARSRLRFRLQSSSFVILVLVAAGLIAWLSTRYTYEADWTADKRNTLSDTNRLLLAQMPEPLVITAYAGNSDPSLRAAIREAISRYQKHKNDIELRFIDPISAPGEVRERGISMEGEMIFSYQGRDEHVTDVSESALALVLQRLARQQERWVVFLSGHGEADPLGQANHDFGNWARHLRNRGMRVETLDFAQAEKVPDNTAVLVLSMPRSAWLPGELSSLRAYLEAGGNLLWLIDHGDWHGLEGLVEQLGLTRLPGMPMDPVSSRLFGYAHRSTLLVSDYAAHPLTQNLHGLRTLFPQPVALTVIAPEDWEARSLFSSHPAAWSETRLDDDNIEFDPQTDVAGPLDLAFILNRPWEKTDDKGESTPKEQRIAIVGDGDFLSNAYLDNSANLDLGLNLVNWLAEDDNFSQIPTTLPSDLKLDLSQTTAALIAFTFLFVVPFMLLLSGGLIWWQRRKR